MKRLLRLILYGVWTASVCLARRRRAVEGKMSADEVIKRLQVVLDNIPTGSGERVYQDTFLTELAKMGLSAARPPRTKLGQPDILVTDSEPPILIEIKDDSDWRHDIAEAAAQLYTYGQEYRKRVVKLATFGKRLQHQHLKGMFDELGFGLIQRSEV